MASQSSAGAAVWIWGRGPEGGQPASSARRRHAESSLNVRTASARTPERSVDAARSKVRTRELSARLGLPTPKAGEKLHAPVSDENEVITDVTRRVIADERQMTRTSDIRITGYEPLLSPAALLDELPLSEAATATVEHSRAEVRAPLTPPRAAG